MQLITAEEAKEELDKGEAPVMTVQAGQQEPPQSAGTASCQPRQAKPQQEASSARKRVRPSKARQPFTAAEREAASESRYLRLWRIHNLGADAPVQFRNIVVLAGYRQTKIHVPLIK